jgi:hypothetical protein
MPPQKKRSKAQYFIAGIAAVATAALVSVGLSHVAPTGQAAASAFSTAVPSTVPAFVSDEFGFSVRFPAKPIRQDQDVTQGEQKIAVTVFNAGPSATGYLVSTFTSVCSPKGDDIGARLKVSADGSVAGSASTQGATTKVAKQSPITVQGHPGLQTDFMLTKGSATLHVMSAVVIDGPRFYTLAEANPAAGAWDSFLKSFKITKDPAPLPECAPLATT